MLLAALLPGASRAQDSLSRCAVIENADERLACYDELARRPPPASATVAGLSAPSYLENAWKLGPSEAAPRRMIDIVSYRPDYLISRWTNRPNSQPRSPATGRSSIPDLDHDEIKFQGSFKTELISRQAFERAGIAGALSHVGIDSARLWFGYTQKVEWQAFNRGESRPITDTNYEPEAILTLGTANRGNGLKLVNLGLSHESNGLDPSEHRGWSRAYAQGGWEWDRLSVLARVWHVIPESDDDNPNIRKYMGSGDVAARYETAGRYITYALARRNLSSGRGFLELDWATPPLDVLGGFKFFLQLTTGYGETLIDYNHHQTTIGAGLAFGAW